MTWVAFLDERTRFAMPGLPLASGTDRVGIGTGSGALQERTEEPVRPIPMSDSLRSVCGRCREHVAVEEG